MQVTPTKHQGKSRAMHKIDEDVSTFFSLSSKEGVMVKINVVGVDVELQVDTGATITVVPTNIYKSQISHVHLQLYNGESLKI